MSYYQQKNNLKRVMTIQSTKSQKSYEHQSNNLKDKKNLSEEICIIIGGIPGQTLAWVDPNWYRRVAAQGRKPSMGRSRLI